MTVLDIAAIASRCNLLAGSHRRWPLLACVMVFAFAIGLTFMLKPFHLFQLTILLVNAIALLGLVVTTGYCGQVSLGHGAFFGIGGYVVAILLDRTGMPVVMAITAAGALSLLVGVALGTAILRLQGHYLALATFAAAFALPQVVGFGGLEAYLGGVQGIFFARPGAPAWSPVSGDAWVFLIVLCVAVLAALTTWCLVRGPVGLAMAAVRDNPLAAQALGIDVARTRISSFAYGALAAGVAGGLNAFVIQFVAPDSYTPFLSISLLIGVIVGGAASISGAFIGAAFLQFVPNLADGLSKSAPWAIYGLALIGILYFCPTGLAGLPAVLIRCFRPCARKTGES